MNSGKITWKTVKSLVLAVRQPVDQPKLPDHEPRFVLRDGVPDLCCPDGHPFYRLDNDTESWHSRT